MFHLDMSSRHMVRVSSNQSTQVEQLFLTFFSSPKTCPCVQGHSSSFRLSSLSCWKAGAITSRSLTTGNLVCVHTGESRRHVRRQKNLSRETCPCVRAFTFCIIRNAALTFIKRRYRSIFGRRWRQRHYGFWRFLSPIGVPPTTFAS